MSIQVKPFWRYAGLNIFKWSKRYRRWRTFSMLDGIIMSHRMLKIVIQNGTKTKGETK